MTSADALALMVELSNAYPAWDCPEATASTWRSWLEALPYDVARPALLRMCAKEPWPKVSALIAECGIGSEQAHAMLVAAKEGGYEIVRDPGTVYGWRTTQAALAPPIEKRERVPCPPELQQEIRRRINTIATSKDVNAPKGATGAAPS